MPENKTDYPQYIGVDYKTPDKDKSPEQIIKEEEIISQINERIIELASSGLITLPKQERKMK